MLKFSSLIISLLFLLASCSPGKPNIKVKFELNVAGISSTSQIMLFAKNNSTGIKISKLFPDGNTTLSFDFPNGSWKFALVAWDGAKTFEGPASCFETTKNLEGESVVIDADLTPAGCVSAVFGGSQNHDATQGFKTINFSGCGQLSNVVNNSSTCDGFDRSFNRSFKIALMEFNELSSLSSSAGLESDCIDASGDVGKITTLLRLPQGVAGGLFSYAIKGFEDPSCGGKFTTTLLNDGIDDVNSKIFASAAALDLFVLSKGPLKTIQLMSESGSSCDTGYTLKPIILNLPTGQKSYIFPGSLGSSSDRSLFMSSNLATNSGNRLLDAGVNPSGEESVSDLIQVGDKVYFVALSDNNYTRRFYSYDGTNTVDLTLPLSVGSDYGNQSGVRTKLIAWGTTIYFGFKDTDTADQILCSYDTLTANSDCSAYDGNFINANPIVSNATGVFYLSTAVADPGNLKIMHFDGLSHTLAFNLTGIQTNVYNIIVNLIADNKSYFMTMGSPASQIFHVNGASLVSPVTPTVSGSQAFFNTQLVFISDGVPHIVDGAATTNLETLSGYDFHAGGPNVTSNILGSVGDYLYFVSDMGTSGVNNIYVYKQSNNSVTQLTFESSVYSFNSVIMGASFYFIPNNSASNTSLFKAEGSMVSLVKILNVSPSYIYGMTIFNNKIYVPVDNGVNGVEPWVSDGSDIGTFLLADLSAGSTSSYPYFMFEKQGFVFFKANQRLYRTKGTSESTVVHLYMPSLEVLGSNYSWEDRLHFGGQIAYASRFQCYIAPDGP